MECVPGNPAVVHHIIVYLVPPGVSAQRSGRPAALATGWAPMRPGLRQKPLEQRLCPLRAEGFQAAVRDALHGQRHAAAGPQLCGLRVCRSEDREEGSGRAERRQLHVQDSRRTTRTYEVESEFVFRQNALLLSHVAAHARARQGLSLRPDLSGRQDGNRALDSAATTLAGRRPTSWPSRSTCRGARGCTAWPTSTTRRTTWPTPTRPSEVGWGEQTWEEMMFGWFEMALADQDLTQPATRRRRARQGVFGRRPTRSSSTINCSRWPRRRFDSDKNFERFTWQLFDLVPQLDRVCVTGVDNDKLRLKLINERLGLRTSLKSTVDRRQGRGAVAGRAMPRRTRPWSTRRWAARTGSIMAGMAKQGHPLQPARAGHDRRHAVHGELLERRGRGVPAAGREDPGTSRPTDDRRDGRRAEVSQ